jgi:hypothetical protein
LLFDRIQELQPMARDKPDIKVYKQEHLPTFEKLKSALLHLSPELVGLLAEVTEEYTEAS